MPDCCRTRHCVEGVDGGEGGRALQRRLRYCIILLHHPILIALSAATTRTLLPAMGTSGGLPWGQPRRSPLQGQCAQRAGRAGLGGRAGKGSGEERRGGEGQDAKRRVLTRGASALVPHPPPAPSLSFSLLCVCVCVCVCE